jgi:hypothetical protein
MTVAAASKVTGNAIVAAVRKAAPSLQLQRSTASLERGHYHFAIALSKAKQAESCAYENDNLRAKRFNESLVPALQNCLWTCNFLNLRCGFAASARG